MLLFNISLFQLEFNLNVLKSISFTSYCCHIIKSYWFSSVKKFIWFICCANSDSACEFSGGETFCQCWQFTKKYCNQWFFDSAWLSLFMTHNIALVRMNEIRDMTDGLVFCEKKNYVMSSSTFLEVDTKFLLSEMWMGLGEWICAELGTFGIFYFLQ